MFIIYGLYFSDREIYIGMSNNIEQRIKEHRVGRVKSTKQYKGLFKVLLIEECDNRIKARQREKYWKSGYGKERLKIWSGSSVG